MNSEIKKIAILGSTGSVGMQSVEVAKNLSCEVDLLMASSSVDVIEAQARELKPKVCVMTNDKAAEILKTKLSDTDIKVYSGEKSAISAIEESSAEVAVNAVSGFADEVKDYSLSVTDPKNLLGTLPEEKRAVLKGILEGDPRPSYIKDGDRVYTFLYSDLEISFKVDSGVLELTDVKKK